MKKNSTDGKKESSAYLKIAALALATGLGVGCESTSKFSLAEDLKGLAYQCHSQIRSLIDECFEKNIPEKSCQLAVNKNSVDISIYPTDNNRKDVGYAEQQYNDKGEITKMKCASHTIEDDVPIEVKVEVDNINTGPILKIPASSVIRGYSTKNHYYTQFIQCSVSGSNIFCSTYYPKKLLDMPVNINSSDYSVMGELDHDLNNHADWQKRKAKEWQEEWQEKKSTQK